MNSNLIWINACEASADNYGAMLMQELKKSCPDMDIMGMGGVAMRASGLQTVFRSEDLSLVGLTEVIGALPRIMGYLKKIKCLLKQNRPDIIILLDAPDFNFRLAKMASSLGIPVLYYIAPQVWAWRKSRVRFLKKHVQAVACIFPFEKSFFQQHGIDAEFAGHPLMEMLDFSRLQQLPVTDNQICILPGSRKREISSLMPVFFQAAEILHSSHPDLHFKVVQAPGMSLDYIRQFCPHRTWLKFVPAENRYETIKQSSMAMAASGTVTLECAVLEVPAVVAYKLSRLSYLAGRMLIRVKHISMPNLIMNRDIYPELIQNQASSDKVAACLKSWIDNQSHRFAIRTELKKIKEILGKKSASRTCARMALELINKGQVNAEN